MILKSDEHGPRIWPMLEENGVTRTKKYEKLSATEKIQANCDLKATNIILQGLPSNVYSLVNHHRLRNSSNPRQQATIHDERVIVQPVLGRQVSFPVGSGKVLNEEELEFLADPRVAEGPVTHMVITYNAAYQADDLNAYDSNSDDFSTAKAVLMAILSSYGLEVLSEIRPMLYDGYVIGKETNVISIADSEETLILEEESRSKMLLKQSDPMVLEKKVNIKPINSAELNRLSKDFGKHFVP
uniref:Retrovirus-related Pol polyprotein from transposon TNT 1-94 n=1 Tax=Tanacetum cinerariifolium TaxID=118510 RepID=A0A6L2P3M0_TANCI|nr:hypothetical protein [Tanacetum cinerariifolium]